MSTRAWYVVECNAIINGKRSGWFTYSTHTKIDRAFDACSKLRRLGDRARVLKVKVIE